MRHRNRYRLEEFTAWPPGMDSVAICKRTVEAETFVDKLRSLATFTRQRESECLIFILARCLLGHVAHACPYSDRTNLGT
jgi:hypothetical protein